MVLRNTHRDHVFLDVFTEMDACIETTRNLLAPAEAAQGLGFAGFDVITVATNHIKDCGLVRGCTNNSMLDTLANLRAQGIQPTGAGLNLAQAVPGPSLSGRYSAGQSAGRCGHHPAALGPRIYWHD